MNVQTLEHFKNIILKKRREILSEGSFCSWIDQEKNAQPVDVQHCHYKSHLADQAEDSMQLELYSYFKARQIKYLRQLEKALTVLKAANTAFASAVVKISPKNV
jgi:RNA polymerase-binding transcription factor DksA